MELNEILDRGKREAKKLLVDNTELQIELLTLYGEIKEVLDIVLAAWISQSTICANSLFFDLFTIIPMSTNNPEALDNKIVFFNVHNDFHHLIITEICRLRKIERNSMWDAAQTKVAKVCILSTLRTTVSSLAATGTPVKRMLAGKIMRILSNMLRLLLVSSTIFRAKRLQIFKSNQCELDGWDSVKWCWHEI